MITTANILVGDEERQHDTRLAPGRYVTISVSDSGVGMDKETISHIFEPFFTTKGFGRGSGLGLSIVHGIVMQSGGGLSVQSEPGKGATFKIFLPQAAERPRITAQPVPAARSEKNARETILLVEDEIELAQMTREILENSGYCVLLAASGEEALQLAQSRAGEIQLLLTDVILRSEMDGKELAARLQELQPHLKVIYTSGYNDLLAGADGKLGTDAILLDKPFSPAGLRAKVRQVLDSEF